jgi:hypothetical protein
VRVRVVRLRIWSEGGGGGNEGVWMRFLKVSVERCGRDFRKGADSSEESEHSEKVRWRR